MRSKERRRRGSNVQEWRSYFLLFPSLVLIPSLRVEEGLAWALRPPSRALRSQRAPFDLGGGGGREVRRGDEGREPGEGEAMLLE